MLDYIENIIRNYLLKQQFQHPRLQQLLLDLVLKKIAQASTLQNLSSFEDIMALAKRSFIREHSLARVYYEIADFLLKSGQPELAQEYYKVSLAVEFTPVTYSGYLQCLMLSPSCTPAQMFEEALGYNQFFTGIKPFQLHTNKKTTDRKLNIAYVCHFFHNNIAQSSLIPFLREHSREKVKIFCYSDTSLGEVSDAVKSVADVWHDTKGLSDDDFAELLRTDEIDVLLELNGHCAINRYGVIARKPVPVQISFYNIATTSGVSGFDYILSGDEVVLDKSQPYFSESIYYVKGTTGAIEFADYFPDCAPPPFLKNGYITFGSFNAAHKVNKDVIKLWCKVLNAIPTAKFYMKAGVLSEDSYVNAYKVLFAAEGIDPERVRLEGFSEHSEMVKLYADMDIALDTFPHGAGTTTMEALWQGVPVVALCGDVYCMQHGKMILSCIGHPELVAYSETEFVNKAVELAADQERLITYRKSLRGDFKQSPRADMTAFAAKLEAAYLDMWSRYCHAQSSPRLEPEYQ